MKFDFTIDDFLNDFSAGFVFIFGIFVTNYKSIVCHLKELKFFEFIEDYSAFFNFFVIFVSIYIIGLAISSVSYFIVELYDIIDEYIKNQIKNKVSKTVCRILFSIIFFIFGRYTVIGTISRLSEIKDEKLPEGLRYLSGKTKEDIFRLEKRIIRDNKEYRLIDRHY